MYDSVWRNVYPFAFASSGGANISGLYGAIWGVLEISRPPRTLGGGIQCQSTLCFPRSVIERFHLKCDPLVFDISISRKRSPESQGANLNSKQVRGQCCLRLKNAAPQEAFC
jgi:hypothetical protein